MILCLGTTPTLARTMRFGTLMLDSVNRTADVMDYASGKAVNAARAVRNLHEAATVLGVIGGPRGTQLCDALDAEGIDHALLSVAAPTRLCITVVDEATHGATELVQEAQPIARADGEALLDLLEHRLPGAAVLVLSGSLVGGLANDFIARCVVTAREAGVRTIVDGSGPALRQALAERPSVVKVNAAELASVRACGPLEDEAALLAEMRRLAHVTGGWIVVTRGSDPTLAADAQGALQAGIAAVERVVSPIGSGDSFAAGLAVASVRGQHMAAALKLATGMAAANVETPLAAHFVRDRAEALAATVTVQAI